MIKVANLTIEEIRQWVFRTLGSNQFYHLDDDYIAAIGCHIMSWKNDEYLLNNVSFVCTEGWARWKVDNEILEMRAQCHLVILDGYQYQLVDYSPDFRFNITIISGKLSDSVLAQNQFSAAMNIRKSMLRCYDDKLWGMFGTYEQLSIQVLRQTDNPFRAEIIRRLMEIAYYLFRPQYMQQSTPLRPSNLTSRFLRLLDLEFMHHRDVAFYADRLCVTPKHLSETVKKTSGQNASHWIDKKVVGEAEHYLTDTSLSVVEICARLGFEDVSSFGKYFKRVKGLSPRAFREQKR